MAKGNAGKTRAKPRVSAPRGPSKQRVRVGAALGQSAPKTGKGKVPPWSLGI